MIGPAGGGLLVDAISWRAIFAVNMPLVVFTLWLTRVHVAESRDPDAFMGIDYGGILLSAAGLAGPVFALIDAADLRLGRPGRLRPDDRRARCFAAFVVHERRTEHPMVDLSLFRIRNFALTNVVTLVVYAGLIGSLFYVPLFLQQVAGYSALEAGLATTPSSVHPVPALAAVREDRRLAIGPRWPMTFGPIVGGIGLLLLLRVDADAEYVTQVLPGILLFALGLSATVAPLTATALDSVEERHVGIASGINNAVARMAGLLAIAVIGAAVAGRFGTVLDDQLGGPELQPSRRSGRSTDARDAGLAGTRRPRRESRRPSRRGSSRRSTTPRWPAFTSAWRSAAG